MSLLKNQLRDLNKATGGALLTREKRNQTIEKFARFCLDNNIQIRSADHIKLRHIQTYLQQQKTNGLSTRSLQNELSNIRVLLAKAGRHAFVKHDLATQKMGVEKASREGTKVAISDTKFEAAMAKTRDPDIAACLALQRYLGLRENEAIRCTPSLESWKKALETGCPLKVIYGTKGGRARELMVGDIPHRKNALEAVLTALERVKENKGRLLGRFDALKEAKSYYSREVRLVGLVGKDAPHSLRYRFAVELIAKYQESGLSRVEALALTSLALGHGDGRGRWVAAVYSKTEPD